MNRPLLAPPEAASLQLERENHFWTNFISSGTPNGRDAAVWPRFNPTTADIPALAPGPARLHPIFTFASDHNCAALAALGY
jgi:hypothetical protein